MSKLPICQSTSTEARLAAQLRTMSKTLQRQFLSLHKNFLAKYQDECIAMRGWVSSWWYLSHDMLDQPQLSAKRSQQLE
jgi:hypothetical protein